MSQRALWTASFALSLIGLVGGLAYTYWPPGGRSNIPTLLAVPLAIIARISLGQMRKHRQE